MLVFLKELFHVLVYLNQSGIAPLIICVVLKSKNMFINFTISLMYYNSFVFKIEAKMPLLFPLVLHVLIKI